MDPRHIQMLLASAGYYKGAIDGDLGPLSRNAALTIERNAERNLIGWPWPRRMIAAAQAVLAAQGHEPGLVDGFWGHNTQEALTSWLSVQSGTVTTVVRPELSDGATIGTQRAWPRQSQMEAVFGPAGGPRCTAGRVSLPIPFIIAWDRSQSITRFSCHELVAEPLTAIYADAVRHYGRDKFEALDLHVWGGCFNHRKMRGGTATSTHAYGIAVDHDPENNQLRWGRDRSRMAQPDYDAWWRIVEAHGGVSLGRVSNFDWMHFQFARP